MIISNWCALVLIFFVTSHDYDEMQSQCQIYFGKYQADNDEKWILDPPKKRIFKLRCLNRRDEYTFDYNDCDVSDNSVTLCSTDAGNIQLKFTICDDTSDCEKAYQKFKKLTFIEGRDEKFTCSIICSE